MNTATLFELSRGAGAGSVCGREPRGPSPPRPVTSAAEWKTPEVGVDVLATVRTVHCAVMLVAINRGRGLDGVAPGEQGWALQPAPGTPQ